MNIDLDTFQQMPRDAVARIVQAAGPKVCVFPINGTRRWFVLNHPRETAQTEETAYLKVIEQRHIDLYQLIFAHGIDTLLTPIFGADLLDRGEAYVRMAAEGMARLCTQPAFLDFYDRNQIRVRFYGDYRKYIESTPLSFLIDLFDGLAARTQSYNGHRLFFGLFANDATETIAELGIRYYLKNHRLPERQDLVTLYYGEYIEPVSFFIGFDQFSAYDMPLLATGSEDLYYTVSPSPDLTERQLRQILFDHLFSRRVEEPDYRQMPAEDLDWMRDFYTMNHERTLGVGVENGGVWYPTPEVRWPERQKSISQISGD